MQFYTLNYLFKILFKNLINCIYKYKKLVISYSGGLDSVVLLDLVSYLYYCKNLTIYNYNIPFFNFRVIHVNHNLNKYSNYWAMHCKNQCLKYNVRFNLISVFLNINLLGGIESEARRIRYKVLILDLKYKEILLTGHHQNDQIETFFLALKRGSGPLGLSGMVKKILLYNKYILIRPLLNINKDVLKKYAFYYKLRWIEDHSNICLRYDRNFIRHKILPILTNRWPFFYKVVFRSLYLCREQENLLNNLLNNILISLINSDGSIKLLYLLKINQNKRFAILRMWLMIFGFKMISNKHMSLIWNNVVLSKTDSIACFNFNNYKIKRFYNRLYILSRYNFFNIKNLKLNWSLSKSYLKLPLGLNILFKKKINTILFKSNYNYFNIKILNNIQYKKNFYFDENSLFSNTTNNYFGITLVRVPYIYEKISVRFGSVNGLIYIVGNKHGCKLKKIWQKLNISSWQRKIIPLLFYNETLIAAIGVFITHEGIINLLLPEQYCIFWSLSFI